MFDNNDIEEREYSFNWLELGIKILIFAVALIVIVWIISLFSGKKCETITNDYYAVSYFTKSQYKAGVKNKNYQYKYTIKILDITPENSKDVSIKASNYFHSEEEYKMYLEVKNTNMNIINQSNSGISISNINKLMNSSLKTGNFTFKLSDIYEFKNNYYIDVTVNVGDHSDIPAYSEVYFVPIHFSLKYTETNKCK